jgi:hypothetical protein
VLRIAQRHRVEGLVADGLKYAGIKTPSEVEIKLATEARRIARHGLDLAAESLRLKGIFETQGIDMIILKGVTLDILAYGGLGVKKAWDIDLLIDASNSEPACALLVEAGYERIIPGPELSDAQALNWLMLSKESLWRHRAKGFAVELHTGLADNPSLISAVSLRSPRQTVEFGPGMALTTFRDEELFAYLCAHGASHGWARLKWLADLAALLSNCSESEIESRYRQSLPLGAGRTSGQALLLCSLLLGLPIGDRLKHQLTQDAGTRWLVRVALGIMGGRHVEKELDDSVFGTIPIQLSHFFLAHGLRHKLAEVRQKCSAPYGRVLIALPKPLFFLYPLLLLPHWAWRRFKLRRARLDLTTRS